MPYSLNTGKYPENRGNSTAVLHQGIRPGVITRENGIIFLTSSACDKSFQQSERAFSALILRI